MQKPDRSYLPVFRTWLPQSYTWSLWLFITCTFLLYFDVKLLVHNSHVYGRSPRCLILMCLDTLGRTENRSPHSGHSNRLSISFLHAPLLRLTIALRSTPRYFLAFPHSAWCTRHPRVWVKPAPQIAHQCFGSGPWHIMCLRRFSALRSTALHCSHWKSVEWTVAMWWRFSAADAQTTPHFAQRALRPLFLATERTVAATDVVEIGDAGVIDMFAHGTQTALAYPSWMQGCKYCLSTRTTCPQWRQNTELVVFVSLTSETLHTLQ